MTLFSRPHHSHPLRISTWFFSTVLVNSAAKIFRLSLGCHPVRCCHPGRSPPPQDDGADATDAVITQNPSEVAKFYSECRCWSWSCGGSVHCTRWMSSAVHDVTFAHFSARLTVRTAYVRERYCYRSFRRAGWPKISGRRGRPHQPFFFSQN